MQAKTKLRKRVVPVNARLKKRVRVNAATTNKKKKTNGVDRRHEKKQRVTGVGIDTSLGIAGVHYPSTPSQEADNTVLMPILSAMARVRSGERGAGRADKSTHFAFSQGPHIQWHSCVYENYAPENVCYMIPVPYMDPAGMDVILELSPGGAPNPSHEAAVYEMLTKTAQLERLCAFITTTTSGYMGSLTRLVQKKTSGVGRSPYNEEVHELLGQAVKSVESTFKDALDMTLLYRLNPQSTDDQQRRRQYNIQNDETKRANKWLKSHPHASTVVKGALLQWVHDKLLVKSPTVFVQIYESSADDSVVHNNMSDATIRKVADETFGGGGGVVRRGTALGFLFRQVVLGPTLEGFDRHSDSIQYADDIYNLHYVWSAPELVRLPVYDIQGLDALRASRGGPASDVVAVTDTGKLIDYSPVVFKAYRTILRLQRAFGFGLSSSDKKTQRDSTLKDASHFQSLLTVSAHNAINPQRTLLASALRAFFAIPQKQFQSSLPQLVNTMNGYDWFTSYQYLSYYGLELPNRMFVWSDAKYLGSGVFGQVFRVPLLNPSLFAQPAYFKRAVIGGMNRSIGGGSGTKSSSSKQNVELLSHPSPSLIAYELRTDSVSSNVWRNMKHEALHASNVMSADEIQNRVRYDANRLAFLTQHLVAMPPPGDYVRVALKAERSDDVSSNDYNGFKREAMYSIMLTVLGGVHANINPCYGWCIKDRHYGMVTRFMPHDLSRLLQYQSNRKKVVTVQKRKFSPFDFPNNSEALRMIEHVDAFHSGAFSGSEARHALDKVNTEIVRTHRAPNIYDQWVRLQQFSNLDGGGGGAAAAARMGADALAWQRVNATNLMSFTPSGDLNITRHLYYTQLVKKFEGAPPAPMSIVDVFKLALGSANGLKTMHEQGLVHRDIKLPNLLADETMNAFITDFGFTVPMASFEGIAGTAIYMLPKYADLLVHSSGDAGYVKMGDGANDMFAWGRSMLELAQSTLEFDSTALCDVLYGVKIHMGDVLLPRFVALCLWCMQARPTFEWNDASDSNLRGTPRAPPTAAVATAVMDQLLKAAGGEASRAAVVPRLARLMFMS